MKRIRSLGTLVVCVAVVLVFVFFGRDQNHPPGPEDRLDPSGPPVQVHRRPETTRDPQTTRGPQTTNASVLRVSDGLRKTIPQSPAYWNRLLYSALDRSGPGPGPGPTESSRTECRLTNQDLKQAGLDQVWTLPVLLQDFLQGLDCTEPRVLVDQPRKCSSGDQDQDQDQDQVFLLFAIKSIPSHFEQRQVIRETWGREGVHQVLGPGSGPGSGLRVRTVFLLGSSPPGGPDLDPQVALEAGLYQDLVQWDFNESLFNLTLKMKVSLRWISDRCPGASFIFSGDDDVLVNTPALLSFLLSQGSLNASHLYTGQIITEATPLRNPRVKYYVPRRVYDGPYPAYAGGGGFALSAATLRTLLAATRVVPPFPIDDVYVGMCVLAAGVTPRHDQRFRTFDIRVADREDVCSHRQLLVVHRRNPQQVRRLWAGLNDPKITCNSL